MSTVSDLPGDWAYLYKPNPTLSADGQGWSAKLSFVTDQSNIIPFVAVISGLEEDIVTSGGTITRVVTLQHPIYDWLWADSFDCEMFGEASPTSTALVDLHSKVKVDVVFRSTRYPTGGDDPYLTWETRGNSLYVTIPGRKMKFASGEVLGQDAGYFVSQTNYILTLYQAPDLNDDFIESFSNKINDATFKGIATGHLRFDTWSSSMSVNSGGVLTYTKQLIFTRQSHHWNQYYTSAGVLETATDDQSKETYETADFSALLGA